MTQTTMFHHIYVDIETHSFLFITGISWSFSTCLLFGVSTWYITAFLWFIWPDDETLGCGRQESHQQFIWSSKWSAYSWLSWKAGWWTPFDCGSRSNITNVEGISQYLYIYTRKCIIAELISIIWLIYRVLFCLFPSLKVKIILCGILIIFSFYKIS